MGSGASSSLKPTKEEVPEEEDEIDVELVLTALFKLSFTFEMKATTPTKLISVIISEHEDQNAQAQAVDKWLKKNTAAKMHPTEVVALIKYVELYEPSADDTQSLCQAPPAETLARNLRNLTCPYGCEVASWTAAIRNQELSQSTPLYADTPSTSEVFLSSRRIVSDDYSTRRRKMSCEIGNLHSRMSSDGSDVLHFDDDDDDDDGDDDDCSFGY